MARLDPAHLPHHVAIIPDGNGRWAESRGLPREAGHQRGSAVVRDAVRAAHELGVQMLTMYAFSTENWDRPPAEVKTLMKLLLGYLRDEANELVEQGIRVEVIGRPQELDPAIQNEIERLVRRTEENDEMRLAFALSYSGRIEIVDAVRGIARALEAGRVDPESIDETTIRDQLYLPDWPDPVLLVRFGGESRLSNFLLWELAYTELFFSPTLWPDFTKEDLVDAIYAYQQRERRLGKTSAQVRRDP